MWRTNRIVTHVGAALKSGLFVAMIDKMSSYVYDSPIRTDDRRTPTLCYDLSRTFDISLQASGLVLMMLHSKHPSAAQQSSASTPGTQPCRKGIRLKNAWAVARVYAATAGIDKEAAFTSLFVDEPAEQALDQTGHLSGT